MEKQLLEDIQVLLLSNRARELRINVGRAASDDELEVIEVDGEEHTVLTKKAGLRLALRELEEAKALIKELSQS
ncbi:hypothetical protein PWP89_13100 [Stenotrophomonas rhizophila]|uniref:hypothetical protein n=1 Tax=Stenotrophomonas rhizophila TaxID=216778 RepID=UPI0011805DB6|nr:hypothetical protein [Stenotrophomonas rhizophila]